MRVYRHPTMPPRSRITKSTKPASSTTSEKKKSKKAEIGNDPGFIYTHLRAILLGFVLTLGVIVALDRSIDLKQLLNPSIKSLATVSEVLPSKFIPIPCSKDYEKELSEFPACAPRKCGRVVKDSVISSEEAMALLSIGKKGLALGGSSGGASILDLHSGALSKEDKFIDIYSLMKNTKEPIFKEEDFALYSKIKNTIHDAICEQFDIPKEALYLTHPTFFSQMTDKPAKTVHDEYWHNHIDKVTYGTFDYTSLLYMTSYGSDFQGGRFIFVDKDTNTTVEPKLGRVSFFTSGSENVHHVEKVTQGTRYAITVSFTCDPKHAISDPTLR